MFVKREVHHINHHLHYLHTVISNFIFCIKQYIRSVFTYSILHWNSQIHMVFEAIQ